MNFKNLFSKEEKQTSVSDFRVGQKWKYKSRQVDAGSTLIITKIETYNELGTIVHISLSGLSLKNERFGDKEISEVQHLPVEIEALRESVTELIEENSTLPNYEFGYVRWKEAFNQEKAGYFAIPLREAVQYLENGTYQERKH